MTELAETHFEALRLALDSVAREKRYLAFQKAPPREAALAFYRQNIASGACCRVALLDAQVVGCCDVLPVVGESRAHVGTLGIWVVASARGQGIGGSLLRRVIEDAWAHGFLRIELTVRADNVPARALYEREGFRVEGVLRHSCMVDGEFFDSCAMALLRDAACRL
ncbi:MAG: GNAT family N-acetyltransferase [Burkholderiaceae bacterium]|nr:GNAT family N-acetyltransferase [Burkholderiaceae bacterium]